eukprot:9877886-Alexandrium_andersonii.AAC.1
MAHAATAAREGGHAAPPPFAERPLARHCREVGAIGVERDLLHDRTLAIVELAADLSDAHWLVVAWSARDALVAALDPGAFDVARARQQ